MKITGCVFLGALLALLLISFVAANDPIDKDVETNGANQVEDEKYYGGGGYGGGGYGGGGYGGGWGGRGGGGWGGRGGGGGWGGRGGGGWGGGGWGGGCQYGMCCGRYGGCRCCNTAQEALTYIQN